MGPWDLDKFRGVGVPGPRERLGFFLNPPDIFSKGHSLNVTSSGGGGNTSLGGVGENKDMKHVNYAR